MSWGFFVEVPAGADKDSIEHELQIRFDALIEKGDLSAESRHQVQVSIEAAGQLASSGALGDELPLYVHVGGHSNPRHRPVAGWSNDVITVSVQQLSTSASAGGSA